MSWLFQPWFKSDVGGDLNAENGGEEDVADNNVANDNQNQKRHDVIAPDMIMESDDSSTVCSSSRTSSLDGMASAYPMNVLFGSATGRAEGYANEIARIALSHGFHATVSELDEVVEKIFPDNGPIAKDAYPIPVIIILSTYIDGQAPDNASKFEEMMYERIKDSNSQLDGLDFCIFGIGDTNYGLDNFNAAAKNFDSILSMLGAERLLNVCFGNDDQDLDADFHNWTKSLWPLLKSRYIECSPSGSGHRNSKKSRRAAEAQMEKSCPFTIDVLPKSEALLSDSVRSDHFPAESISPISEHYFSAVDCIIKTKRELRSQDDQLGSTLHFEIDVAGALEYSTGDLLGVMPQNDETNVSRLARKLGFNLDDTFVLFPSAGKVEEEFLHIFPTPCGVRECLSLYCDLTSTLSRSCLQKLAAFATSTRDWSMLTTLASSREEYQRHIVDAHVGIVELVCDICPSIKLSLKHFIYICRRLAPRMFAITSSSLADPQTVHFDVSIAQGSKPDGTCYTGVCSSYLQNVSVNSLLRVFCKRSKVMKPPADPSKSLLMIGPGVGGGALIAILKERSWQKHKLKRKVGKAIVYFGCKNHWLDDIYAKELEEFRKDGIISHLYVAYSREHVEKVYVQYLLAKNAEDTFDIISKDAHIYISGGMKMGDDVLHALTAIFAVYGNLGPQGALKLSDRLVKEGRLSRQLW
mmetsp:Transcript_8255/g.10621  ORF Transcript_8255/g.10621 Transcript_8255/m.10621 type:complete len:695 (-) Transcript_8255:76-2160(-)|eukprot:CAMPEP_0116069414 /NCGR_PEP_ID=MMETSP0322-20121206/12288_1 /TAXON_ID=163516 /ORGANISM="Leptocylindrus danicus var. apora, Strain B651" /LENGTH=694 /DNA_ID=CAMNT_0003556803 /DNA_START=129 /DNA_END=2213 /DNA_ORIENTATION=+